MKVVLLDYPSGTEECTAWKRLAAIAQVERYHTTTLPDLLERGRTADVIVTWKIPFRREILDYMTRPHRILVPAAVLTTLVELPIATQLGIRVEGFSGDPEEPCVQLNEIAGMLEVSE